MRERTRRGGLERNLADFDHDLFGGQIVQRRERIVSHRGRQFVHRGQHRDAIRRRQPIDVFHHEVGLGRDGCIDRFGHGRLFDDDAAIVDGRVAGNLFGNFFDLRGRFVDIELRPHGRLFRREILVAPFQRFEIAGIGRGHFDHVDRLDRDLLALDRRRRAGRRFPARTDGREVCIVEHVGLRIRIVHDHLVRIAQQGDVLCLRLRILQNGNGSRCLGTDIDRLAEPRDVLIEFGFEFLQSRHDGGMSAEEIGVFIDVIDDVLDGGGGILQRGQATVRQSSRIVVELADVAVERIGHRRAVHGTSGLRRAAQRVTGTMQILGNLVRRSRLVAGRDELTNDGEMPRGLLRVDLVQHRVHDRR